MQPVGRVLLCRSHHLASVSGLAGSAPLPGFDYTQMHGTTVLCLQRDRTAVLIADGQVSMGSAVFKVRSYHC